jgi:hypothetical protein
VPYIPEWDHKCGPLTGPQIGKTCSCNEDRGTVVNRDRMLMEDDMTNPIDESKQNQVPKPKGVKGRRRNKGRLEEAKQYLVNIFVDMYYEAWLQTPKGQELLQQAYNLKSYFWKVEQQVKQLIPKASER